MKIDIIRNNNDPFARYKMPKLEVQIEGRASNTRTILQNLSEVALSLKRPAIILLKYIGYEKGTQTDTKNNKYSIKGSYNEKELQDLIYTFIEKYVLCDECNNPETCYIFEKNIIVRKCYACGSKTKVEKGRIYNLIEKETEKNSIVDKNYQEEKEEIIKEDIDAIEDLNIFMENKAMKKEDVVQFVIHNMKKKENLSFFKDFVDSKDSKYILGLLEIRAVDNNNLTAIVDEVDYLIDESILTKIDCFKYFQVKSKTVKREESSKIRELMKEYFDK